jgi:hypothetical protein
MVSAAVLILTIPRLLRHELWRDEAWVWLAVTSADSFSELFSNLGRAGNGYLFPLMTYGAAMVWPRPLAMQVLNLLMASAAVFVLVRDSPFPTSLRVLLAFGYFPFYEYAVISRHYALATLLLWIACAAASRRRPLLLGIALGLLCQTSVYGVILSVAVGIGWLADLTVHDRDFLRRRQMVLAGGFAVAVHGAIAGIVQVIPAPGTWVASQWRFFWDESLAVRTAQVPWRGFVPWPQMRVEFWNSNILDSWPRAEAIAGAVLFLVAIAILWRQTAALVTFVIGGFGLLAFSYLKLIGESRHWGQLWLLFLAALWLGGGIRDLRSWRALIVLILAVLHAGAALYASWIDLRQPFSNAGSVADLLRRSGLRDSALLGHREPPAAPVSLALGRPLYSPSRRRFVTHPYWGPTQREMSHEELRCVARDLTRTQGRDVVIVSNAPLPSWPESESAGASIGAIVKSENYYLYRMIYSRLEVTSLTSNCAGR